LKFFKVDGTGKTIFFVCSRDPRYVEVSGSGDYVESRLAARGNGGGHEMLDAVGTLLKAAKILRNLNSPRYTALKFLSEFQSLNVVQLFF
jgi:hypothetical protein